MTAPAYPPLSSLIPPIGLGSGAGLGELSFLNAAGEAVDDFIADVLEPLSYRDLSVEHSASHDIGVYRFTAISEEPIKLDLLAGLKLILLPDAAPGAGGSAVGVTFAYEWPIKGYVKRFQLGGNPARAAFDLFLQLAGIGEKELYGRLLDVLAPSAGKYDWLAQKLIGWTSDFQKPSWTAGSEVDQILNELDAVGADAIEGAFKAVISDAGALDVEQIFDRLRDLFEELIGEIDRADFEALLLPRFRVTLDGLSAGIEFPTKVLTPLDGSPASRLVFTAGAVTYDTGTGFDIAVDEGLGVSLTPSAIGKTGLTLQIDRCKLDLSRTHNIAEATADQRPSDFMGVYFKSVVIGLPPKWFHQASGATLGIVGREVLIGTGGITGTIGLEALAGNKPAPDATAPAGGAMLEFVLGKKPPSGARQGFKVGFSLFHMKFRQNVLLESRIKGSLTVPKFNKTIGVELYIAADGDFKLTATAAPPVDLEVPNVFIFKASKVSVGKDDDRVYLETSGDLSFENNTLIGSLLKTPIHIEKFLINSDGSFELEGGSIPLPQSAVIRVGPAKIAITALHFGAHEQVHQGVLRKYRYWGFDGGVSVNPGGVDCRGDGIKFYFTVDGAPLHCFLRIEGIGIDLVIPGTASKEQAVLILKGYLSLKNPEYLGSISFSLPKVKIAGGGTMKYNTSFPAWAVDVWLELPMPILVGSTGLGIYGFRGLFGLRYMASKEAITKPQKLPEDASWGDYYRAPQPAKGLHLDKLMTPKETSGAKNPLSIGAGVSLATSADKGKAFSSQLFLLVSLPELIILEGRADILAKQRVGLTGDDPPYYAYLALSRESIELGAGVTYLIPKDSGKTLNLSAVFEAAYFWRNSSAWYVHFGTKAKPMTARIIDLFDGYAYLMLSASGIEAGAGVHFEFSKSYGPVSVDAYAYLDTWAYISFERAQAGGGIALGGHIDVTFMKVGFYISLDAGLTVEVPTPYRVAGHVEVCVTVNLKIKSFSKCVDLNFEWKESDHVDMSPVDALVAPPAAPAPPPAAAVHMMSGATYPVEFSMNPAMVPTANNDWAIPLDAYIDVKLGKRVDPFHATGARIGGATAPASGNVEIMPPRYGERVVEHAYSLERVALEVLGPNGWRDYRPYEAIAGEGFVTTAGAQDIAAMPVGLWQLQDPGYGQLRFLALTPFSFLGPTEGHRPEEMGLTAKSLYCVAPERPERCLVWREPRDLAADVDHFREGVLYRVEGAAGAVTPAMAAIAAAAAAPAPAAGPVPCRLAIGEGGRATFLLPGPAVSCRVRVTSQAPQILLRFQRRRPSRPEPGPTGLTWPYSPPEYEDVLVTTVSRAALANPVVYNDPKVPIERIVLETPVPDRQAMAALEEAIALRRDDWYRAEPRQRAAIQAEIDALAGRLREAHARTCVDAPPDERDDAAFEEGRKRTIALIREQLDLAKEGLAARTNRYERFCAAPSPGGPVPIPLPLSPPMSAEECRALAKEIDAWRNQIVELERFAAQLQSLTGPGEPGKPAANWACGTFVHEICWLSEEDWRHNKANPGLAAIAADYEPMRRAAECAVAPIWRPHQTYRITIAVRDTVKAGGNAAAADRTFYVHFKTKGPIGSFRDPPAPAAGALEDPRPDSPEQFLKYYIDRERSFPDPGGDLLYAKPLFYRDAVIELHFARPHAYHFFAKWPDYGLGPCHYEMAIRVKDPAEAVPAAGDPAHATVILAAPILGKQSWNKVAAPPTPEFKALNNLHDPLADGETHATACLSQGTKGPVKPAALAVRTELGDLLPNKLYTAVVLNRRLHAPPAEVEVHRYPFKTSRYPDFASQIGSYRLTDESGNARPAVFAVDHQLADTAHAAQAYAAALQIVKRSAAADPAYPDYFDQLLFGCLKLAPIPPAGTLEFNFVTNSGTGETYGLWIRGPEALNDPRASRAALESAIRLFKAGVPRPARVIMSKDCCQAFLMVEGGPMPTAGVSVAFDLLPGGGRTSAQTVATDVFAKP